MSEKTASAAALSRPMRLLCIGLLVLLGFSLGCSEFVVIGIEVNIADAFSVTLAQAGELISMFAITYAACTPVLAIVTGRFRRFQLLVTYAAIFCAANLVQALAPTFAVLLLSRVLIGAVSGAFLAVGVTFIPELMGPERMSVGISVVYAAFSVAMVVATSAGKMVAELFTWRVATWASLALAVVTCVALVAVLPREGATDEPATMREQAGLLAEPQVLTGILIFVFGVGCVYVFYGYVTPYLEQVLGLSAMEASAALMGYGVVCFFSNLLSGWLDARFGMRALVVTFPLLAALLFGLWALGAAMPAALAVVMGIALLMYVASVPCISAFMETARRSHPKALTLASSLEPMSFNIGIAFGTAVGGAVVSGPGIANVGLVGGVFALVALALVALTLRLLSSSRTKAREGRVA
ncbi:MFS transporter [Parolsenella catena]|uniref:MFS transporter n=1 Tax=Parolsenella catena TaxID=2003188 RepID=UPI00319E0B8C